MIHAPILRTVILVLAALPLAHAAHAACLARTHDEIHLFDHHEYHEYVNGKLRLIAAEHEITDNTGYVVLRSNSTVFAGRHDIQSGALLLDDLELCEGAIISLSCTVEVSGAKCVITQNARPGFTAGGEVSRGSPETECVRKLKSLQGELRADGGTEKATLESVLSTCEQQPRTIENSRTVAQLLSELQSYIDSFTAMQRMLRTPPTSMKVECKTRPEMVERLQDTVVQLLKVLQDET